MKYFIIALTTLLSFNQAFADKSELPICRAELNDPVNQPVSKIEWQEDLYFGFLQGASRTVLITTSLGNDKIMSLWVREKHEENPAGMFSFVDLASGRDQYMRFYMADGYSVGVTCRI